MKKLTSISYYIFFFTTGVPLILIGLIIWAATIWWDKRLYWLHWYTSLWSAFLFLVVPGWRIKVYGQSKIDNSVSKVFASNHQSEFDIVVVGHLLAHFKWVSKSEVFKGPIIGWNMRLNRYIELKRGDRKSIVQMVRDSMKALEMGSSVFIFPEGTRSLNGIVGPFAAGAFVIAKKQKVGVQPIVINGTKNIMEKGDWKLNFRAQVTIEVLDYIPYQDIAELSPEAIAEKVRSLIVAKVDEHQAQ
jgi:1-acyl-sn-glycerol-3-phosphate acyltransferase